MAERPTLFEFLLRPDWWQDKIIWAVDSQEAFSWWLPSPTEDKREA